MYNHEKHKEHFNKRPRIFPTMKCMFKIYLVHNLYLLMFIY